MTTPINEPKTTRAMTPVETLAAIVANAHPGGLHPGKEIPPSWFEADVPREAVASALPDAGDRAGIFQAVVQMCSEIRDRGVALRQAGKHPLLIGGDHAMAMGSIASVMTQHERAAVIWIDAHADFNTTTTSPSGNPHGMPLAAACGFGDERLTGLFPRHVRTSDVVIIGARSIDPEEAKLLEAKGIWHVSVPQLREMGVASLVTAISERFGGIPVHVSFDFDSISEEFFPATGTPVGSGLTPGEAEALLTGLRGTDLSFCSSDWVEFHEPHEKAAECAEVARRMFGAFYGV